MNAAKLVWKTIAADALAVEALDLMRTHDITQLVVTGGNKYLGFIHLHDLIREGQSSSDEEQGAGIFSTDRVNRFNRRSITIKKERNKKMNKHYYVVIMAGGIGSRFWPRSRQDFPKQFLDILNTGKTLIQWTFDRFVPFIPAENIYVVTSHEYTDIVHDQLPGLPAENILGEPSRKNTAPCIAYISFKLQQIDPQASLIVAPADHLILDTTAFTKVCSGGAQLP